MRGNPLRRRSYRLVILSGATALIAALHGPPGSAQQSGDWPAITGGYTSTRYSTLDQINASNFNNLAVAWEWRGAQDIGTIALGGEVNARSLPIYVDGMLITT